MAGTACGEGLARFFSPAMELDALVPVSVRCRSNRRDGWTMVSSVLRSAGKPVRRLAEIETLEIAAGKFVCGRDLWFLLWQVRQGIRATRDLLSNWNLGTYFGISNRYYTRAWTTSMQALAEMELTRKVLQVKDARHSGRNTNWTPQLVATESALCPEAMWVHEVLPDGRIQIYGDRVPEWLKMEHSHSTPLKYSLEPASQRRTPL